MRILEILEAKITVTEKTADDKNFLASISFVASLGDKLNLNGRLYPSAILKREAEKFGKRVSGQLNHPDDGNSELDKVSHTIEKLWFDDKKKALMATAKVLKTTSGRDLMRLINAGVSLGASTRGYGDMIKKQDDDGNDYAEISDDYKLGSIDLVSAPSFGQDTLITSNNIKVFESENFSIGEGDLITQERESMKESFREVYNKKRDLNEIDETFESWLADAGLSDQQIDEEIRKDRASKKSSDIFNFEQAIISGFTGTFEQFKKTQLLPEQDIRFIAEFEEAKSSGFRGTMEDYLKAMKNEN